MNYSMEPTGRTQSKIKKGIYFQVSVDPDKEPGASWTWTFKDGEITLLTGPSGSGKSRFAKALAGIESFEIVDVKPSEKGSIGLLLQDAPLIDSLTVAGNLALSIKASGKIVEIKKLVEVLESVGLNESFLGAKVIRLSGGERRRVALAQLLLGGKRYLILDEPFVGLDPETANSIVQTICAIGRKQGVGFLIITHQYWWLKEYSKHILSVQNGLKSFHVIDKGKLPTHPPSPIYKTISSHSEINRGPARLHGIRFDVRLLKRFRDFMLYPLPVILAAFLAAGGAMSFQFADMLNEVDFTKLIEQFQTEIKYPSLGEQFRIFFKEIVFEIVKAFSSDFIPALRSRMYVSGVTSLFFRELGPLLTGLLLSGMIGGAYTGKLASMERTQQIRLLKIIGISPKNWISLPAWIAGFAVACPLTFIGTTAALFVSALVAQHYYFFYDTEAFNLEIWSMLWTEWNGPFYDHPVFVCVYKSLMFITIIMVSAEAVVGILRRHCRTKGGFENQTVSVAITLSIVSACVLIIIADFGLSFLPKQLSTF